MKKINLKDIEIVGTLGEDPSGDWFTIELNGKKVGYVELFVDVKDGQDPDEERVYVQELEIYEDYRNMGIGTEVLTRLATDLWFGIYLAPTNEDNQRLYERLGEEWTSNVPEVDQGLGVYIIDY